MKKILKCVILALLISGCSVENKKEDENKIEQDKSEFLIYDNTVQSYTVNQYEGFAPNDSIILNGASADVESTFDVFSVQVHNSMDNMDSISFVKNGLMLIENHNYTISFNIASTIDKDIRIRVVNQETAVNLYDGYKTVNNSNVSFTFKSNVTSYASALVVDFGGESLKNFTIELSDVQVRSSANHANVKVNQLGYEVNKEKEAMFTYYDGDYFGIYNEDDKLVYRGTIKNKKEDYFSQEYVGVGDFSDFDEVGTYYIVAQNGNYSYEFEIGENMYDQLLDDTLRMISTQRCGHDLSEELYKDMAHAACHNRESMVYWTYDTILADGGWHDAGDYGRFTNTALKTMMDLMLSYMINEEEFNDELRIVESGNGVNDLLDEIKVGTDYLLSIQRADGGIYSKVVTEQFADFVSPEDDLEQLYALQVDTPSMAFASAVFAIGSVIFEESDPTYSQRLEDAAYLSYKLTGEQGFIGQPDIEEIDSGHYVDHEDVTERYLMEIAMWYMTQDDIYLDNAFVHKDLINEYNVNYSNPAFYGSFIYAYYGDENDGRRIDVANEIVKIANDYYFVAENAGYLTSLSSYHWGSNGVAANQASMMLMAYLLNGDYKYVEAAYDQVHYFLGRNSINHSYITGYGENHPDDIHHRFTEANNADLIGALVGGANENLEEGIISNNVNYDTPPSKSYIDDSRSYSTNEVAIYYNSPLIFVLSTLNQID